MKEKHTNYVQIALLKGEKYTITKESSLRDPKVSQKVKGILRETKKQYVYAWAQLDESDNGEVIIGATDDIENAPSLNFRSSLRKVNRTRWKELNGDKKSDAK